MDTTDLCFICDEELNYNNRVQLTNTYSRISNKTLPEIFAGVLGEDYFVVILNENDYACKNCASLLNQVDQLERNLKLVKNALLTDIKKKHGLLVPAEDVQDVKVDKKDLNDERPPKVSHPLKLNTSHNILINDINRGIEFLRIRHKPQPARTLEQVPLPQQVSMPQRVPMPLQVPTPQRVPMPLQVPTPQQVPMPTRSNAIQPEEPIISENATKILTPVVKVDKKDLNDERPPKISHPLKLNKSHNALINDVSRGIEFLRIRHKPQVPTPQQVPTPLQVPMPTHSNAIQPGEPIISENASRILTPVQQKKMQLYRCVVCDNCYYNRDQYAQHVQRDH